jgi:hypothetical protein
MGLEVPAEERKMNRALVDDEFRSKLDEFHIRTELCDKDGQVLGVFIPAPAGGQERQRYECARAQYSVEEVEELELRSQERAGLTTEQVLQRLRQLAAE